MRRRAGLCPGWLRGFWPDRNPLRRRCDRAEAVILSALLALFVVGGTLAALAAGRWVYDGALHVRRAELSTWDKVPAVLLTAASEQNGGFLALAQARWTGPDGARHSGQVPAIAGAPAGTTVDVWVDKAGRLAGPPLQPSQAEGQAVLAGMLAAIAVAVVLWAAGLVTHYVTDRCRLAAWDADWRATGPKWSHRG
jgi:hypothetical protein